MHLRLLLMILLLASCRVNEMACPTVKTVKLNKRPENYLRNQSRSLSASGRGTERNAPRSKPRPVKTIASIEEWDCPRPGAKTPLPRAVRENIKRNRKKFDAYYRNRVSADTLAAGAAQ